MYRKMIDFVPIAFFVVTQLACNTEIINEEITFPENFEGIALVLYNQKDGVDLKVAINRYDYIFPPNGIIKTNEPLNIGKLFTSNYFIVKNGQKKPLKYESEVIDSESIVLFDGYCSVDCRIIQIGGKQLFEISENAIENHLKEKSIQFEYSVPSGCPIEPNQEYME